MYMFMYIYIHTSVLISYIKKNMRFTTFTFPAFSVTDALQRMHWNYGGQSCTLGGTLSSRRGAGRSGCRSMMQGEHLTGAQVVTRDSHLDWPQIYRPPYPP